MKKLFVILAVVMIITSVLVACGDMTGINGYVIGSPSPDVTLVPSSAPAASPKASASHSTSSSPAPTTGAQSSSAPDNNK